MNPIMSDILTDWVGQQAEQARLVNAVAKAAAEMERAKCCRDACPWCMDYGEPSLMSNGRWCHASPYSGQSLVCFVSKIRERGYQEDQANMNA